MKAFKRKLYKHGTIRLLVFHLNYKKPGNLMSNIFKQEGLETKVLLSYSGLNSYIHFYFSATY